MKVPPILVLLVLSAAASAVVAQDASRSAKQGAYTAAQAARGTDEYRRHCASCHKDDMSGTTEAPPVFGDKFIIAWQDSTVNDLYELVRGTMPYDQPNSLPAQAYADIVAAMLQRNNFPAGSDELRPDADALKNLTLK